MAFTIIRWSIAILVGVPALVTLAYIGLCIVAVCMAVAQSL